MAGTDEFPKDIALKHSSGDLHSRLKTRKLLGVGETDDGDVHRSKLSQILGHSEQLYVKLPKGLRIWQFMLAIMFSAISLWALLFPRSLYTFTLHQDGQDIIILPMRLYGTAMLSFSMVYWATLRVCDKDMIKWSLLSSVVYFGVQILVSSVSLLQLGMFLERAPVLLLYRVAFCGISAYFYWTVANSKTMKSRRSVSTQDASTGVGTINNK